MKTLCIFMLMLMPFLTFGKDLVIGVDDWKPYQWKADNGNVEGFSKEVVHAILTQMNIKYTIQVFPFARAEENVKVGRIDALFSVNYKKKEKILVSIQKNHWSSRDGFILLRKIQN